MMNKLIKKWIKKGLRNYKIQINQPDLSKARNISVSKTVVIIGSGLGGIACASVLAERGFKVIIKEKNSWLGGKLGAWPKTFTDGTTTWIDHGFHAFFYQYYNLRKFFKKIGADHYFLPIGEYLIYGEKINLSFKAVETIPVLNLLAMRKLGLFKYSDILTNPKLIKMLEFLKYSEAVSFLKYDNVSFQDFADDLKLPKKMRTIFISFTRAFFADPDKMSLAELIKSFHFFYLSHDFGIFYDYLAGDCYHCFIEPVLRFFESMNIRIDAGEEVKAISTIAKGFRINEDSCEYAVIAADIKGAQSIFQKSLFIREKDPGWYEQIIKLKLSQGYAVYKIWIDKFITSKFPAFFIVNRFEVLDAFTQFNIIDKQAGEWASINKGGVYELHCYAVPEKYYGDEEKMKTCLFQEMVRLFPELTGCRIKYESFHMNNNFTAFHKGLHALRPKTGCTIPNLFIAGDWVKIETPAMLMEGAFTSGLLAANEILKKENLSEEPVESVPLKGLLAK